MKNEASECQMVLQGTEIITGEVPENSLIMLISNQTDEDFEIEAAEMLNWKQALVRSLANYKVNHEELDRPIISEVSFTTLPRNKMVSKIAKSRIGWKE